MERLTQTERCRQIASGRPGQLHESGLVIQSALVSLNLIHPGYFLTDGAASFEATFSATTRNCFPAKRQKAGQLR